MLWLCLRLPQLPCEVLAGPRAQAHGRVPHLERAAMTRLALWAQQWSSHVSGRPPAMGEPDPGHSRDARLWLEIGGSLQLFGGLRALCAEILAALAMLDYRAELAVAPTPRAALLLTHAPAARGPRTRTVLTLSELPARLAPLPLEWLALPGTVHTALRGSGLTRIGEVLTLSAAALARRFGPEASLYLQRLQGLAPDPLPKTPLPRRYRSHAEFSGEVKDSTALLFPLQRLLWELQGYLRARDCALQRCTLRLQHDARTADTTLTLSCAQPTRAAAQWLTLARERFAALKLAAPVRTLHLEAEEFVAPMVLQGDFFAREHESAQQLQQVLDRLRARLGSEAVQQAEIHADHRPEQAWRTTLAEAVATAPEVAPAAVTGPAATIAGPGASNPRPCWLLPDPVAIHAPTALLAGPERIESGWWDGGDVARDYYLAIDPHGARQWVFQDLRSLQWYLQGLWA
jgi:protein ImuB